MSLMYLKSFPMLCDLASMPLPHGHFRHVCRRPDCGRDVQTVAAAIALRCRAVLKSEISNPPVSSRASGDTNPKLEISTAEIQRRLAVCRDCTDHVGTGCWKDRVYGCQRAYREAARLAAETADCPIGKLR